MLKDGGSYTVPPDYIQQLRETYQSCDVMAELRAMAAWLDANPGKRKTRVGMKRFITAWLQRADKAGGSPYTSKPKGGTRTRDMTTMQDLTMNFTDDPVVSDYFLEKYGEVYERNSRGVFETRRQDNQGAVQPDEGRESLPDPETSTGSGAEQGHSHEPEGQGSLL